MMFRKYIAVFYFCVVSMGFGAVNAGEQDIESPELLCREANSCDCSDDGLQCDLLKSDAFAFSLVAGEKTTIWWGLNLKGSINYSIQTEDGNNSIDEAWWVIYPFGSIKDVGQISGSGTLKIPGIKDFSFGAKLVVKAKTPAVLVASDSVAVSNSLISVDWLD